MNTESKKPELISALIDGELSRAESDQLFTEMTNAASDKIDWSVYHQIGDVLRSDDLAVSFSADFSSRFSALLDQEPVILVPHNKGVVEFAEPARAIANGDLSSVRGSGRSARFWGVGGLIAASLLIFAVAPRLNNENADGAAPAATSVQMAQTRGSISVGAPQSDFNKVSSQELLTFEKPDIVPMQMLRDPQLDNFLMGHQKGSASFGNAPRFGKRNELSENVSTPYFNTQAPAASSAPSASDK